ncbi:MAG: Hsp20/alpha crystallin family protein [Myxococcaceae bacterium]|nr:Hsp20/alpha crystallin family protein [Myxococcaceae bacterium]
MADITVRRQNGNSPTALARDPNPFRVMRDWLRWDPFQDMAPNWPALDAQGTSFIPAFEVKETKDRYLFKADVPGIKEEDLNVTVTGNRLQISGKREEEKEERNDTYYACERSYGTFTRSFTLPEGADFEHVHADLKTGVLTVAVPKKVQAQSKKISVQTSEKTGKI